MIEHPKIVVTSECPNCQKEWKREEYIGIPIGVIGLSVCEECDNSESVTLVGNTKYWEKNHE